MFKDSLFGKKSNDKKAVPSGQKTLKDPVENTNSEFLHIELEHLKSKLESYNEMNKLLATKFANMEGMMGEVRGTIEDHGAQIADHGIRIGKSLQYLKKIRGQEIPEGMERLSARIESLHSKFNEIDVSNAKAMGEFNEMKENLKKAHGLRGIVKSAEEAKGDMKEMKKVQLEILKNSDKVEDMHNTMQAKYGDFMNFAKSVRTVKDYFEKLAPQVDKIFMNLPDFIKKSEINPIREEIRSVEDRAEAKIKDLELMDQKLSDGLRKIEKYNAVVNEAKDGVIRIKDEFIKLTDDFSGISKRLDIIDKSGINYPKLRDEFDLFKERLTQLSDDVESQSKEYPDEIPQIRKEIAQLSDRISMAQTGVSSNREDIADDSQVKEDIHILKERIAQLAEEISSVDKNVGESAQLRGDVAQLSDKFAEISEGVDKIEDTTDDGLRADVDILEEKYKQIEESKIEESKKPKKKPKRKAKKKPKKIKKEPDDVPEINDIPDLDIKEELEEELADIEKVEEKKEHWSDKLTDYDSKIQEINDKLRKFQ